jgi:thiosulfate/3-mercaptopyruvate sulfurtransferase
MYCGVEDVRLLNGGFNAWKSEGYEVETKAHEPISVESFGVQVPAHPEYIVDTKEAKEVLANDNEELVSIRSWAEYLGETSGYSYIKPKGRIKGAVWGHAGSDPYHMEDYRNLNGTMRNYQEIAKNWEDFGITPNKKAVFYCGTGWRASEAFFDAYLMGWENIAVYDGGWYEWSMDESNPVDSGEIK